MSPGNPQARGPESFRAYTINLKLLEASPYGHSIAFLQTTPTHRRPPALAGANNGDVVSWDYSTGEEIYEFNFQQPVTNVEFRPDEQAAFLSIADGRLIEWHIAEQSLPELLDWIKANRNVRPLTDAEKLQYHIEP